MVINVADTFNSLHRPERFSVQVSRGKEPPLPLRQMPPGTSPGSVNSGTKDIPAGGSYSFSLLLSDWVELKEPGTYTVTASRTFDLGTWDEPYMLRESAYALEHLATQASTRIVLRPYNRRALGTLIDERGRAMMQKSDDLNGYMEAESAARALAEIDDVRTVPWFSRAITEATEYSGIMSVALGALSRFNDDAALAALVQASRAADNMTRYMAALRLGESPHPGALDALIQMRSDPHEGVRNGVLQKLAKTRTLESLQLIREMTNDPDQALRSEARRYLEMLTSEVATAPAR
jgi:hypothetical protein